MERSFAAQEIILVTGTSFSSRVSSSLAQPGAEGLQSPQEQLLEACWNGLLQEILPEICGLQRVDQKLFLWQVREGESILELDRSPFPTLKDVHWSIDPYEFIRFTCTN